MRLTVIVLSSVLSLAAALPYIHDVVRGRTKPRLASWLMWSILPAVASAAAFATSQLPAAVLSLCIALQCALIVVLGYKHGSRVLAKLDVTCLVGALLALGLWGFLNSPAAAALTIVLTDFLAAIPTLRHSWERPYEETWLAFALSGTSGAVTLLAVNFALLTAVAFPLYIAVVDFTITFLILVSPHRGAANGEPLCMRAHPS
jgi:hypothetical protein